MQDHYQTAEKYPCLDRPGQHNRRRAPYCTLHLVTPMCKCTRTCTSSCGVFVCVWGGGREGSARMPACMCTSAFSQNKACLHSNKLKQMGLEAQGCNPTWMPYCQQGDRACSSHKRITNGNCLPPCPLHHSTMKTKTSFSNPTLQEVLGSSTAILGQAFPRGVLVKGRHVQQEIGFPLCCIIHVQLKGGPVDTRLTKKTC